MCSGAGAGVELVGDLAVRTDLVLAEGEGIRPALGAQPKRVILITVDAPVGGRAFLQPVRRP